MKLPFTINLSGVKGVASRLNPSGLLGKIKFKIPLKIPFKLPFKFGGKKKAAKDEDEEGGLAEDGDMFGDLGDLDALDAAAKERQGAGDGEEDEDEVDYTTDTYTTDKEVDLDDLTSGRDAEPRDAGPEDAQSHDLPMGEDDALASEGIDLSTLEAMPDFDENLEDEDEDDEETAAAGKKKKLLLIAGGGVAAAVLIGAGAWYFFSAASPMGEAKSAPVDLAASHNTVVSLENIPMAPQETPNVRKFLPTDAQPNVAGGGTPAGGAPQAGGPAVEAAPMSAAERTLSQLGLNVAQEPGVGVVVPSVTTASFAHLAAAPPGKPLKVAPEQALVEQTDVGPLPKIGPDGLTPFDAYARPEPVMDAAKPKVAIIVTGLGMSRAATEEALNAMPQDVTVSLNIYARGLDFWVARAREDGHEILLDLPLESANFPFEDPGPEALRVLGAPEDNIKKLQFILSRTFGYFGVLANQGGKFLSAEPQVQVVMDELKTRGLMYVDGGVSGSLGTRVAYKEGIPWAAVEINLDQAQSRAEFKKMLKDFEDLALKRSVSIARVSATPMTVSELHAWLAGLDQKGIQLVPVSALAKKQLIR